MPGREGTLEKYLLDENRLKVPPSNKYVSIIDKRGLFDRVSKITSVCSWPGAMTEVCSLRESSWRIWKEKGRMLPYFLTCCSWSHMTLLANEGTEGMCNAGQGIYSFFFFISFGCDHGNKGTRRHRWKQPGSLNKCLKEGFLLLFWEEIFTVIDHLALGAYLLRHCVCLKDRPWLVPVSNRHRE